MFISSLPTEQKTASGWQKGKPVFESYLKIACSYDVFDSIFDIYTSKARSKGRFLLSSSTFVESWEPNLVFGGNLTFGACEQYATAQVPRIIWNFVF